MSSPRVRFTRQSRQKQAYRSAPAPSHWRRPPAPAQIYWALGVFLVAAALWVGAVLTRPGQLLDVITSPATPPQIPVLNWLLELFLVAISPVTILAGAGAVALIALLRTAPLLSRLALAGRALGLVAGANLSVQALKKWILWRPEMGIDVGVNNSLPSGHTTVAAALTLALVMVSAPAYQHIAAAIGAAVTTCVALGTILYGWHRLADILAALLITAAWACLLRPGTTLLPLRRQTLLGAILTGLAGIFLILAAYLLWDSSPQNPVDLVTLRASWAAICALIAAATATLGGSLLLMKLG